MPLLTNSCGEPNKQCLKNPSISNTIVGQACRACGPREVPYRHRQPRIRGRGWRVPETPPHDHGPPRQPVSAMIDVVEAFLAEVDAHPEATSVEHLGTRITYAQLAALSWRLATMLRSRVGPKPKVFLAASPSPY